MIRLGGKLFLIHFPILTDTLLEDEVTKEPAKLVTFEKGRLVVQQNIIFCFPHILLFTIKKKILSLICLEAEDIKKAKPGPPKKGTDIP